MKRSDIYQATGMALLAFAGYSKFNNAGWFFGTSMACFAIAVVFSAASFTKFLEGGK